MREESAVRILFFTAQGWRETATSGKRLPHLQPVDGLRFFTLQLFPIILFAIACYMGIS